MRQLEFELDFTEVGARSYRVRAKTQMATAESTFELPADLDEQLSIVEALIAVSSGDVVQRSKATRLELPVRKFGKLLSGFVFTDAVRLLYQQTVELGRRDGGRVSIIIRVTDQLIQRLPWELLWDDKVEDYFAFRASIIRSSPSAVISGGTLVAQSPLCVLVVAANPSDFPQLDIDLERTRLEQAVAPLVETGQMELTWLSGDRHRDLQNALRGPRRWHMLHFIGHGGFDEQKDEGYIALVRENATTADHVTATELNRLLTTQDRLRVIVLNACDTGRAAVDNFYASTAAALVKNGVAAVVAMQYPVSDGAAAEFTKTLYADIAAYQPIDQAVLGARLSLARHTPTTLEWATPVLYLQSANARLFEPSDEAKFPAVPAGDFLTVAAQALSAQQYDYALSVLKDNRERWTEHADEVSRLLADIGDVHRESNRLDAAREVLLLAAEAPGSSDATTQDLLTEVAEDLTRTRSRTAELLTQAESQIDSHEWDLALNTLDLAQQLDPENVAVGRQRLFVVERRNAQNLLAEIEAARSAHNWSRVFELLETERAIRGVTPEHLTGLLAEHGLTRAELTGEARSGLFRQGKLPAEKRLVLAHPQAVSEVYFSPNGSKLLTCADDGKGRAWWISDGSLIEEFPGRRSTYVRVGRTVIDFDDKHVTTVTDKPALVSWLIFDANRQKSINVGVNSGRLSAALSGLIGIAVANHVEIWDIDAGVRRYIGYRHHEPITEFHFVGPARELLLTSSRDRKLRLWSVPDDKLLLAHDMPDSATRIVSDHDGRCVAALVAGQILYWPTIEVDNLFRTLHSGSNSTSVDVSKDGRFIIAGFDNRTLSIFDTVDGARLKTVQLNADVHDVSFGPDGLGFAVACSDGMVFLYKLDHGSAGNGTADA